MGFLSTQQFNGFPKDLWNPKRTKVKITTAPSKVVVLTPNNFDEVVLDETKDVLVECRHCRELAPTYKKVAAAFKMEEEVVVANLDADKYKDLAAKYDVKAFPTLTFFPKSKKAGEGYGEGRDLDDIVAFLNDKCGTSRDREGRLTSKAGIVESLDALVKEFAAANHEEEEAVFARMEEEVGKLNGSALRISEHVRYGAIYLKAARNCMDKDSDYAKNEIQCLRRILDKCNHALVDWFDH